MRSKRACRTEDPKLSLRAEFAAFAASLALQSATFNLFIFLSFLVLHNPTRSAQLPQPLREATSPLQLSTADRTPNPPLNSTQDAGEEGLPAEFQTAGASFAESP